MARKKNKTIGKLLVVGGIGLGGYYLYKVGNEKGWWQSLLPNGGTTPDNSGTTPDNGDGPADPVKTAVDSALAVLGWLQKNNKTIADVIDTVTEDGTPIDETPIEPSPAPEVPIAPAAAATAGMSAADIAWNAFGVALPVWLGTSKQAAELTHQANVALTHAIGQETGLEKGIRTLFTSHGAFLANSKTHQCYNMAGRKITCPAAEDVIGIEQHSYEAFLAGLEA